MANLQTRDATALAMPWVVFRLQEQRLAFSSAQVREMIPLESVTPLPGGEAPIRGMMEVRGQVMPLMDLRLRLVLPTLRKDMEELRQQLRQREQEHLKWLDKCDRLLAQKELFPAIADPDQCAFGRWYRSYQASSFQVSALLLGFEKPHAEVHRVGQQARHLAENGQFEQARDLINRAKHGPMKHLSDLLVLVRHQLENQVQEIAVILTGSSGVLAVAVDDVLNVEMLEAAKGEGVDWQRLHHNLVSGVGQTAQGHLVMILDVEKLISEGLDNFRSPPRRLEAP